MFPMSLPALDLRLKIKQFSLRMPLVKRLIHFHFNSLQDTHFYKSLSFYTKTSLPSFFFFITLFICLFNLFLAALGLRCCARAFSSCGERGLLFVAVHGILLAVASLVAEHRRQGTQASVVVAHGLSSCDARALEHKLSSCGAQAQLLHGMWDLPRPGLEPVSPALAGGFLTTAPPGKPQPAFLIAFFPSFFPTWTKQLRKHQGKRFEIKVLLKTKYILVMPVNAHSEFS